MTEEQKNNLMKEVEKLHNRHLKAKTVAPDYFEPGEMEYLEQSNGDYNSLTGEIFLQFEAKGTRYDGRTEQIEKVKLGDAVRIIRDKENKFNHNNFLILTEKGKDIGCMPAELCNAIAPLYDEGILAFEASKISFVEPLSKRSRYAKQAVIFVEVKGKIN